MSISLQKSEVYTDMASLQRLKFDAANGSATALEETAEQFEAVFLQMMLKSMRKATPDDGIFDNDQTRFYQDMFDKQIAMDMAKKRQMGIADMMVSQLGDSHSDKSVKGVGTAEMSLERLRLHKPISSVATQAFAPAPGYARETIKGFDSPQDFVQKLWPLAEKYGKELGVDPKVLLAQSALETGWGKHVIQYSNGVKTHNLFNIKADQRWDGPRAAVPTLEYEGGRPVREYAAFRAYPNFEASFEDYVNFLQSSPRYQQALESASNSDVFIQGLHEAGYATDPKYVNKINRILNGEVLGSAASHFSDGPLEPLT